MEAVTKSDLKELMKELPESMKESIREAVAAGFGNSKPALEQATTSTVSQLLAMDASDAEVLAPAYSSLDQGTSALDLAPTATIDLFPELAASTHASCSTDCHGHGHDTSGDGSMFESPIPWGMMQSTAASLEASRTQPCRLFLSLELDAKAPTRCSTKGPVKTASALKINFVPRSCSTAPSDGINSYVEPPPWLPGWTSTGLHKTWECLLHVPARPPDSLNSTQCRLFPWRPHLAAPAPKPPWLLLGHELVGESHGGKLLSHGGLAVCELIICNEFSETAHTTTKSEAIQGNLSSPPSGTIMNDPCNLSVMWCLDHVLLRMKKWWSNIQCTQLGDANSEASLWPGRHIIGSCLASPVHKFTDAIDSDMLYTHILHGQIPKVGNQLTQCRAQPWLGKILVQIATSQTGANCCFRGTSHQVEKLLCCYWGSDQEMFSYGRVGCRSKANDKEEMTYYICDISYEFYRETLDLVGSMWKTYSFRFNWISLVGLVQCRNMLLGDVLSAPQLRASSFAGFWNKLK